MASLAHLGLKTTLGRKKELGTEEEESLDIYFPTKLPEVGQPL